MIFDELNLDTHLLMAIYECGYTEPTEIQQKSIPVILSGKNLVGRSETGSGKTLAFLIPIMQKIDLTLFGSQALIICPTRELSMQVCEEAKHLAREFDTDIRVVSLNGGADFDRQKREIKKGAQIIVGTVGRIEEHIMKKSFMPEKIKYVVLDEADEMLTLGFREDVEYILNRCDENVQKILFSATFPDAIKNIINHYVKDEVYVEIGKENTTVTQVKQYFIYKKDKVGILKQIVSGYPDKKILIFANTKSKVEELYNELKTVTKALFIHGDIMQNERHRAMQEFKTGYTNVLIATDVASRGIDVQDIFLVINFELPMDVEYYIHRVGRTARAGKDGTALTLIHNKITNKKIIELAQIINTPIKEAVFHEGKLYESETTYIPQEAPHGLWEHSKKTSKNNNKPKTENKKPKLPNREYKNTQCKKNSSAKTIKKDNPVKSGRRKTALSKHNLKAKKRR